MRNWKKIECDDENMSVFLLYECLCAILFYKYRMWAMLKGKRKHKLKFYERKAIIFVIVGAVSCHTLDFLFVFHVKS